MMTMMPCYCSLDEIKNDSSCTIHHIPAGAGHGNGTFPWASPRQKKMIIENPDTAIIRVQNLHFNLTLKRKHGAEYPAFSSSPNGPDLVKRYEASGKPTINTQCRIIHYPVRLKARVLGTSLKLNLIVCHTICGLYSSCAH